MKIIKQYKCSEPKCTDKPKIKCNYVVVAGCEQRFCYLHWPDHLEMHRKEWDALTEKEKNALIEKEFGK